MTATGYYVALGRETQESQQKRRMVIQYTEHERDIEKLKTWVQNKSKALQEYLR